MVVLEGPQALDHAVGELVSRHTRPYSAPGNSHSAHPRRIALPTLPSTAGPIRTVQMWEMSNRAGHGGPSPETRSAGAASLRSISTKPRRLHASTAGRFDETTSRVTVSAPARISRRASATVNAL